VYAGVSSVNLDAKGRFAVPARYRDELAESCASRVVVTVNPSDRERCLLLYPENEWFEIVRGLSRRDSMQPKIRAMQRLVVGYASELELDGQGRVLLSSKLREFARLGKRIALVGQINKLEIWDEDAWNGSSEHWLSDVSDEDGGLSDDFKGFSL
jgi:MraZ protein